MNIYIHSRCVEECFATQDEICFKHFFFSVLVFLLIYCYSKLRFTRDAIIAEEIDYACSAREKCHQHHSSVPRTNKNLVVESYYMYIYNIECSSLVKLVFFLFDRTYILQLILNKLRRILYCSVTPCVTISWIKKLNCDF